MKIANEVSWMPLKTFLLDQILEASARKTAVYLTSRGFEDVNDDVDGQEKGF